MLMQVHNVALVLAIMVMTPSAFAQPPNDECVNAIALGGDGTYPFDNAGATSTGPQHPLCLDFGEDDIYADSWYCWQACADTDVTLSTCGLAAFDTKIAVYESSDPNGCDCVLTDATIQACVDDTCGLQTELTFPATANTYYAIRIGAYDPTATGGQGELSFAGAVSW